MLRLVGPAPRYPITWMMRRRARSWIVGILPSFARTLIHADEDRRVWPRQPLHFCFALLQSLSWARDWPTSRLLSNSLEPDSSMNDREVEGWPARSDARARVSAQTDVSAYKIL